MLTAIIARFWPNNRQRRFLAQQFGCNRLVYNLGLDAYKAHREATGKSLSYAALCHLLVHDWKVEKSYLTEVTAQALQQSLVDLSDALNNHFKHKKRFPRYKNRYAEQSTRFPQDGRVDEHTNTIFVPKLGTLRVKFHKPFPDNYDVRHITIKKNPAGQYQAFILIEDGVVRPTVSIDGPTVGVDVGITHLATLSTGEKIDNPKHSDQHKDNLRRQQRKLARCQRGSKRYEKQRIRVAKVRLREKNCRKDTLHKTSRKLVNENQVIVFETLNTMGMMKNHHLARAIADAGWGMLIQFCRYKAQREGKAVLKCGRWLASSKLCSACGSVNRDLKLSQRVWTCEGCNTEHDRDHNAATNIVNGGLINNAGIGYLLSKGILQYA